MTVPFSNSFPPEMREDVCPQHGAFEARRLLRTVWTKCQTCEDDRKAVERAEADRAARKAADGRHKKRMDVARIPVRFLGRSFDNFVASTDAQRSALTIARSYAEDFADNHRRGLGLIFAGMPGTGKSHLASAILQSMLERDVRYVTCLDMIREIRATWRKDSERSELQELNYLGSLDLLVIDEVGVQYGTDGEQTHIFDVLDRRYRDMRPTILLTNQDRDGFRAFVGERVYDRLTQSSRWVPFDWASYRPQARKDEQARALES